MGGNAFSNVEPLSPDDLRIAKEMIPRLMDDLGVTDYAYVGSATGEGPCGDIDIALSTSDKATGKSRLLLAAKTLLGNQNVKSFGQLVCLRWELPTGKRYQIDLIPCTNVPNVTWLMRGLFRHMLFALLAKDLSERTTTQDHDAKVTITIPHGIGVQVNSMIVLPRTNYPTEILNTLEFPPWVKPHDVMDLKGLAHVVAQFKPELLQRFPEYVAHLKDKKGHEEALKIVKEAYFFADWHRR